MQERIQQESIWKVPPVCKKMYDMYVEKRQDEGCKTPASETTYRNVFNREFNISFHKRMKDQCDVCAAYENGCFTKAEDEDYKKHIQMKEESRQLKHEVKAAVKINPCLPAAVFDLEEVLPTPSSVESCLYYKRKLNMYNLTVYDYRNGQGYFNVWAETTAMRGSNEIASCVYRYLERITKEGVKKVTLFSDSCGGQNRNKNFLTMLWYALRKFEFEEIEHIFFMSGHSQIESDSMHSVTELSSRHVSVYTSTQWAQTMRTAKLHAPLYIVEELDQSDFFDLKKMAGFLKNFSWTPRKRKSGSWMWKFSSCHQRNQTLFMLVMIAQHSTTSWTSCRNWEKSTPSQILQKFPWKTFRKFHTLSPRRSTKIWSVSVREISSQRLIISASNLCPVMHNLPCSATDASK